ncbi:glycosyltransferase [Algoriphagus mannitolivorans]|uniref:glycosyltransferase n=1 Tax=Algoriphagus mannitolivorans TaxID=226504 RepID=UPI00040A745F|nr:glycosyltransferase [Algoriphagus mannitolivorans]
MITHFVSIVIPYYKNSSTILRTIESIFNQTENDWELIVVDDGSEDNLSELLEKFNSNEFSLIKKTNSGPSDSRNMGAKVANGKYLAFLDSDDWLAPNWLESFKSTFNANPFDICFCYGALIDEATGKREDWKKFNRLKSHGIEFKFNNLVGTFLVKKEHFELSGGFDNKLRYSENLDLLIRLIHLSLPKQRGYIEQVLVFFGNTLDSRKRNNKYARSLMLKDLGYFQMKHKQFMSENPIFLKGIIRRQLVSATVCWSWKIYLEKVIELYSLSLKDGIKFTILFFLLPLNRARLLLLGFRK